MDKKIHVVIIEEFFNLLKDNLLYALSSICSTAENNCYVLMIISNGDSEALKINAEFFSVKQASHVHHIDIFYESNLYKLMNIEKSDTVLTLKPEIIYELGLAQENITFAAVPLNVFTHTIGYIMLPQSNIDESLTTIKSINTSLSIPTLLMALRRTYDSCNSKEDIQNIFIQTITHILHSTDVQVDNLMWQSDLNINKDKTFVKLSLDDNDVRLQLPHYRGEPSDLKIMLECLYSLTIRDWEQNYIATSIESLNENIQKMKPLITAFNEKSTFLTQYIGEHLTSTDSATSQVPFAFYKGSSDWVIRFEGQPVLLSKRMNKGLEYIHKLLTNPNQLFYTNELELSYRETNEGKLIQISQDWSVSVSSVFQAHKTGDEAELKRTLQDIQASKPDEIDPIKDHIRHWSYMLYLSDELLSIVSRKPYIELHQIAREQLEDKLIELQLQHDDEDYVRKILTESKIIRKAEDFQKTKRQIYQRVTKAMKNAINAMDSHDIKEYFDDTLIIAQKSVYKPEASVIPTLWKLQI